MNNFPSSLIQPIHQIIYIDDTQREALKQAVSNLRYPEPEEDYEEFVLNTHLAVLSTLSKDTLRELMLMKTSPFSSGTILLRGLPIDDHLPSTPISGLRRDYNKKTSITESILIGIASILGHPIGHEEEKDGHLIHDVIPVHGTDKPLSNEGAVNFGLHVENAMFEDRESFLILSCLRPDPWNEGATPVVDIREVISLLNKEEIAELRKEQFIIRKPYILDRSDAKSYSDSVAILSGSLASPQIRCSFYDDGTKAITKKGKKALAKLELMMNQQAHDMKTEAGDMLLINNRTAMHGRKAFRTTSKGNNRHLLRVYIMSSLWSVREAQQRSIRILRRSIF